ncbi:MAG: Ni/Fe-hydrogenase, b-type cytochrome subunit [Deltaproteobacteria bacterium]|nr:Ni/Fe-hydrogenase, b-type cytochrome subunit [Deltaproteobacteria bacterium]
MSHRKHDAEGIERVYVWDLLVRMTHWIIMICVFMLAFTGVYIGDPFLIPAGPANEQFVMATTKVVHFYTAIIFTLAVASRIAWMFVGSYYARWHQFVPVGKRRRGDVLGMLKFYSFLSKEPPMNVGHNPLAGSFYLLVFGLYLTMILTGFALYSVSSVGYMQMWEFLVPIFGGLQMARWIHHLAMWFLLGFVAHHIWSAMLVSRVEGMGLIDSLFSGYKFLPKSWRNRDD